jgi:hypothetical protein
LNELKKQQQQNQPQPKQATAKTETAKKSAAEQRHDAAKVQ